MILIRESEFDMEKRKLTKEDLDKVRHIEGFPIGKDEDIIALSDPPYYTACPNPFIADFIKEHGTPYDEATDDYHREPFASDVSEGKTGDIVYNAHSYHTKVPYRAIMRYILHYTEPGDIIFDGFCGTGMTGVAAQMCNSSNDAFKFPIEASQSNVKWGMRYAILSDIAIAATHIASNYNLKIDGEAFDRAAKIVLKNTRNEYNWLYETTPPRQMKTASLLEKSGEINTTIWSNIVICPHCGKNIVFYDAAIDDKGRVADPIICHYCSARINKSQIVMKDMPFWDDILDESITQAQQIPVFKIFTYNGKRYTEKINDFDLNVIKKFEVIKLKNLNMPTEKMLFKDGKWGDIHRSGYHKGFTHSHHFYTKRNAIAMTALYNNIKKCNDVRIRHMLMFALTATVPMLNRTNRWRPSANSARGPINGILYIPSIYPEINVFNSFEKKIDNMISFLHMLNIRDNGVCVSNQSSTYMPNIKSDSVDYIFVDPPFGDNIMYSESNFLWESWLRAYTDQKSEAIVNKTQGKQMHDYHTLMKKCFAEFYRILKPNRWLTVEFHNSKNTVWNAIQQAVLQVGFVIADIRTLDKKQGSFKQVTTAGAVKQDLVISAYKPKNSFTTTFTQNAGTEETAWAFVRQHLANLPVVVKTSGKIETVTERQAFLLFDRMVAYHIMQGLPVPIDAADFYKGLDDRFLKRDRMYFLPDQVNEYDLARSSMELEKADIALFVTDEKSAIGWLYVQLDEKNGGKRQTYQVLQPKFMQEVRTVKRTEKMPELITMLEENFLEDDSGAWYVPDPAKSGDVAKLREKNLLKEFQEYQATKGKLKVFRSEAIRVGFAKLWKDKEYKAIVALAERLPEETVQEDPNILMYYDISLSRV